MKGLKRLARLWPALWSGLPSAYWWLVWAWWHAIRTGGRQLTSPVPRLRRPSPPEEQWLLSRVRLVRLAARYPVPWARCLQQSLALQKWLAQDGVETRLCLGVRKEGRSLKAHAWLEYQGRVLNDVPWVASYYRPLTPARPSSGSRPSDKAKESGL